MRIPRRTPFEHPDNLGQLYHLLYPSAEERCDIVLQDDYRQQREQGLALVHVWLNRSACPHAVESTSSLIHAQLLDEQLLLRYPGQSSQSEWVVRSTYAMAVLRFVNSVADTFQTTLYAQSIFQISQKIGLPAYLVELRHAATHEELPSLSVLRGACQESLSWLQNRFWRPMLSRKARRSASQSDKGASQDEIDLSRLRKEASQELKGYIARYRKIAKAIVKDESLRGRYKTALMSTQSKIEAVAKKFEDKACRKGAMLIQGENDEEEGEEEEDNVDGTAAGLLIDLLLEPGGIIPLSKRKRPNSKRNAETIASVPMSLHLTWKPLLDRLSASIDSFSDVLLDALASSVSESDKDASYLEMAASWAIALFGNDPTSSLDASRRSATLLSDDTMEETDARMEQDKPSFVLAQRCLSSPTPLSLRIARDLCRRDEKLLERVRPLLALAEDSMRQQTSDQPKSKELTPDTRQVESDPGDEMEQSVREMERKLQALQETPAASAVMDALVPTPSMPSERDERQRQVCQRLPGWQLAPKDWQASPLGCLNGRVPPLILPVGPGALPG